MKLIFAAAMGALVSLSAGAQTCANPETGWLPDSNGSPDLTGSTCGQEAGIVSACDGNFHAPGAAYVLAFTPTVHSTYANIWLTGGPGFTPVVYVVDTDSSPAPCAVGGGQSGDTGRCVTSGSSVVSRSAIPDGHTYYLIITGSDFDADGACGSFSLHADGTYPVSLQTFTVD
jgi:hypothetical protein